MEGIKRKQNDRAALEHCNVSPAPFCICQIHTWKRKIFQHDTSMLLLSFWWKQQATADTHRQDNMGGFISFLILSLGGFESKYKCNFSACHRYNFCSPWRYFLKCFSLQLHNYFNWLGNLKTHREPDEFHTHKTLSECFLWQFEMLGIDFFLKKKRH